MKKIIPALLFFCCAMYTANAQTPQQTERLATLAKVWGFLKYYHPAAAKGQPEWDSELIQMIPLATAATSPAAFSKLLDKWLKGLGSAGLSWGVTQRENDTLVRIFDEKDIKSFGVDKSLAQKLKDLYLYHYPDSSRYITNLSNGYTLDYTRHNEDPFTLPAYPDKPHRLLALFRYWNIINYFYPIKKTNAPGWDQVLTSFIPQFIAAKDSTEYRLVFRRLTTKLKDSHSIFYQPQMYKSIAALRPAFSLTCINGKYYISESRYDSLMKQMDTRIGDEIVSINGEPVAARVKQLIPYTTGTNQPSFDRNIANFLLKIDTNRSMKIGIQRQGNISIKNITLFTDAELARIKKDKRPLWEHLGNDTWLVRICDITKPDTLKKLFADIQQAKKVIFDLRAYPVFNVVQQMRSGLFNGDVLSTISYNSWTDYPGVFIKSKPSIAYGESTTSSSLPLYKGQLIVLVNEQTQSLSESIAAELRSRPNTIVMGNQTAGTTGNITWVAFPGGITASFTAVGVEDIHGNFAVGQGVKIDRVVQLTPETLVTYPDYMLEMARKEATK